MEIEVPDAGENPGRLLDDLGSYPITGDDSYAMRHGR
jgi:hypothetical protein